MRKEIWEINHEDSEERRRDLSFCYMRLKDSCRNLFDLTFHEIFREEIKFTKRVLEKTREGRRGVRYFNRTSTRKLLLSLFKLLVLLFFFSSDCCWLNGSSNAIQLFSDVRHFINQFKNSCASHTPKNISYI